MEGEDEHRFACGDYETVPHELKTVNPPFLSATLPSRPKKTNTNNASEAMLKNCPRFIASQPPVEVNVVKAGKSLQLMAASGHREAKV